MSARLVAAAIALLAAAPLAAQQDTGMMAHDTGMMSHDAGAMSHDAGAMSHDTGMMSHDTGMMSHDSAMGDHDGGMMAPESGAMGHGGNTSFSGAEASGGYQVTDAGGRTRLSLTSDFAVADAPDLYLLLSAGATDRDALTLGRLKRQAAGQNFDLPRDKDLGKYTTLVVWSRKERRAVATADWHAPDAMGR
jgi:hypothetical protein